MSFNPTIEMLRARDGGIKAAWNAADNLIKAASIAHAAIVHLPHTNEKGEPVMHGANMEMVRMRDTLMNSFNSLTFLMAHDFDFRDYMDYLKYSYHYASGQFRSDEEWAEKYSYLDAELVKLKAKLDIY